MTQMNTEHRMSLREKNLYKRRVNKEHNSNFRAGYVSINEEQLHKTGIRGRKRYLIYLVTCLVIAAVVVNLLITLILFGVLRLNKDGMEGIEFITNGRLLRFLVDSDMGDMHPMDNTVGGMMDEELQISTEEGELLLRILDEHGSNVHIDKKGIIITSTEGFTITDPESGEIVFSTDYENHARFPSDVMHIKLKEVVTGRITSDVNEDLIVKANNTLSLRGGEGIQARTAELVINGRNDVQLTAKKGEISLDAAKGINLNRVISMPRVDDTQPSDQASSSGSYKICVCMPAGKLFAIPPRYDCHEVTDSERICAT